MKTGSRTNNQTSKVKEYKKCIKCQQDKDINAHYHVSYSLLHGDKKVPICKQCLYEMYDEQFDGSNAHSIIQDIMKQIDKPYIYHLVDSSIHGIGNEKTDNIFRIYIKNVVIKQYSGLTYKDSIFDPSSSGSSPIHHQPIKNDYVATSEIVDKWGDGYSDEEYRAFEKKYNSLKNNYPERTAMHTEALFTYIRYRVKEELATAKNDSKGAKEWGTLAKDAATAAKINPSQLSKADLSEGLDSFSQLVRSVEQAVDIIEILPRFKKMPQDDADFTIWCYVNYIRDLKGLPPATYEDVYRFYEERKKEYDLSKSDIESDDE